MKSIYDFSGVKSVAAWALLYAGENAGKVIGHYGNSRVNVAAFIYAGPLADNRCTKHYNGSASGYGYCKFSAAFDAALIKGGHKPSVDLHGSGKETVRAYLESLGYTVLEVI